MNVRTILAAFALALAGTVAASPMEAQQVPGPHPAYLHALSDLRAARHYLNDGWAWAPVRHDDDMAIREIDAAISEIKQAAINDGKGGERSVSRSTNHLSPHDRFRKANELLFDAHHALAKAEDVPASRGVAGSGADACGSCARDCGQCGAHGALAVRQGVGCSSSRGGFGRPCFVHEVAWVELFGLRCVFADARCKLATQEVAPKRRRVDAKQDSGNDDAGARGAAASRVKRSSPRRAS